ncbi:hypothetical protein DP61_4005 [Burkholderia pseudomallei]|nr:hypothetical protein DP61_4005 [Burkholderia pseudomallei]
MAAVHARRVAVRGGREIGCALGALSDGAHRRPFGAPVECPAVQVERTPRAFAVARRLVRDAPLHRRGRTARPHLHDRHRGRRAPRSAPRRHGARERGVARVATPAERDEPRGRQHVSLPDVVSVDRARRRSRKPVAVQDERDRHAAIARRALRRIESAPSRRPGPGRADAGGSAQRRDSARMPAHAGDPPAEGRTASDDGFLLHRGGQRCARVLVPRNGRCDHRPAGEPARRALRLRAQHFRSDRQTTHRPRHADLGGRARGLVRPHLFDVRTADELQRRARDVGDDSGRGARRPTIRAASTRPPTKPIRSKCSSRSRYARAARARSSGPPIRKSAHMARIRRSTSTPPCPTRQARTAGAARCAGSAVAPGRRRFRMAK